MWQETEGAKFWLAVLKDLRRRGIQDVMISRRAEGLPGGDRGHVPAGLGADLHRASDPRLAALRQLPRPTGSRSRRIRASRRGGHLLTRAPSPSNKTGLGDRVRSRMPLSRTVAPYSPPRRSRHTQHPSHFIPDTNAIEALNRQLRKALKTRGHVPNEDAARKLIASPSPAPSRKGLR